MNHSPMNYLNGSMASVRVYTKVLNVDQVKELYDWQKDFFFGTKSTMTLTKGNLGLGVSSPTDRLEVVGRIKADSSKIPTGVDRNNTVIRSETGSHDRPLVKYPEIKMTAATTSGYTAEYSSQHNSAYPGWNAFNGVVETTNGADGEWISGSGTYNTSATGGAYLAHSSNSVLFEGQRGEYLGIILPSAIKLDYINVYGRPDSGSPRTVREYIIWGSNDGSSWTQLKTGTNTRATAGTTNLFVVYVNATNFYSRFRLQVLSMNTNEGGVSIGEMQLYGHEQGDVSTDVTLSSVYNKPSTDQLSVWIDPGNTESYPGSGSKIYDLVDGREGNVHGDAVFDLSLIHI